MRIDIITVHPQLLTSPFEHSILKRAQQKNLVEINIINLRDYATTKHKNTDDYAFGGSAGMVMMIEPIDNCITSLKSTNNYDEVIYLSPDGELLTQSIANQLSLNKNLILLCGHYKGIDEEYENT
jgi:tRNA (guanine37-N1)-methyltransferase